MRVIVTGAAGFLGAHLAARLALDPRVSSVIGLDRVALPGPGGITADIAAFAGVAPPADLVLHAAAITTQASEADPDLAHAINVEGTRAVLRWARAQPAPPRIVLLSSVAVLGRGGAVATEAEAPDPRTAYGTTKLIAERLVLDATRRGEADGVILRLPVTIVRTAARTSPPGAGFVSDLIDSALRGLPLEAPLARDHAMPVASLGCVLALVLRAALGPVPARLLHVPSLAGSAATVGAALAAVGLPADIACHPDPGVAALIAGWPARLGTIHPGFSSDVADAGLEPIILAHAAAIRGSGAGRVPA